MTLPERLEDAYMEIGKHCGYWACIDEAADVIRVLEAALRKYGGHLTECNRLRRSQRRLLLRVGAYHGYYL